MRLFEESMEDCRFINENRKSDGVGSYYTEYSDGEFFKAAIIHNNTIEARIAEKQGVTSVYTVTTPKSVGLKNNQFIRRVSDGRIFRITSNSNDQQTPKRASFQFEQVSAERTSLPND